MQHLMGYLEYLFAARGKHSVHSPFLFEFVSQVINGYNGDPNFERIEKIRSEMLASNAVIKMQDFGASEKHDYEIKISKLASNAAKRAKYCKLLYRIVNSYRPQICIELGTNLGISAMYQALGLQDESYLHTIEGSSSVAEIAQFNINKLDLQEKVQVHNATFEERLPWILEQTKRVDYLFIDGNHVEEATLKYFDQCLPYLHNNSIVVFDDINWSTGMQSAWLQIQEHHAVTATIDLYFMGVVFLRKELSKENFTIRF